MLSVGTGSPDLDALCDYGECRLPASCAWVLSFPACVRAWQACRMHRGTLLLHVLDEAGRAGLLDAEAGR